MTTLSAGHFAGSLYFRGKTHPLTDASVRELVKGYEFSLIVETTLRPDKRLERYSKVVRVYIPERYGKEVEIAKLEQLAEIARVAATEGNVLIISEEGTDLAPAICAIASMLPCDAIAEIALHKGVIEKPRFRALLGL